jgi:hypothetical protein
MNDSITPSRKKTLNNKVIVIDGLVGGGKGLLSSVVSSIPRVEMFVHRSNIEQICSMYHLKNITLSGAISLIKTWVDEDFYNLSMSRNVNFRFSDLSSVFKDPRTIRHWVRLFQNTKDGAGAINKIIEENRVLNLMTHSNSAYSRPIFEALGDRLVYIRLTRCPMSNYLINHLSNWSQRWGHDVRNGWILHQNTNSKSKKESPFFMLDKEDEYSKASPQERAVMMMDRWQTDGDIFIDKMKAKALYKIIEVPFEKFVIEPDVYIQRIASAIDTGLDSCTKKELKKQGVPRKSITDAPFSEVYTRYGWKKPEEHLTFTDDIDQVRGLMKRSLSKDAMSVLNQITSNYINRYDL